MKHKSITTKWVLLVLLLIGFITGGSGHVSLQPSIWAMQDIDRLKRAEVLSDDMFGNYQSALTEEESIALGVSLYEAITKIEIDDAYLTSFDADLQAFVKKALYIGLLSPTDVLNIDYDDFVTKSSISERLYRATELSGVPINESFVVKATALLEKDHIYESSQLNSGQLNSERLTTREEGLCVYSQYYNYYKSYYLKTLSQEQIEFSEQAVVRLELHYNNNTSKFINASCFADGLYVTTYHDFIDISQVDILMNDGTRVSQNIYIKATDIYNDIIVLEYNKGGVKPAKIATYGELKDYEPVTLIYRKPDGTVKRSMSYASYSYGYELKLSSITGLSSTGGLVLNSSNEVVGIIASEFINNQLVNKAISIYIVDDLNYSREMLNYFIEARNKPPVNPRLILQTTDSLRYELKWMEHDADYYKLYKSIDDSPFELVQNLDGDYKFYWDEMNFPFTVDVPNGHTVQFKLVAVKGNMNSEPFYSEIMIADNPESTENYVPYVDPLLSLKISNQVIEIKSVSVYESDLELSYSYPYMVYYYIDDYAHYHQFTSFFSNADYFESTINTNYWHYRLGTEFVFFVVYEEVVDDLDDIDQRVLDQNYEVYYNPIMDNYRVILPLYYVLSDTNELEKINR